MQQKNKIKSKDDGIFAKKYAPVFFFFLLQFALLKVKNKNFFNSQFISIISVQFFFLMHVRLIASWYLEREPIQCYTLCDQIFIVVMLINS